MAEKPNVQLEPSEQLYFRGPVNEILTCQLKLTNPNPRKVCFKVKTTAPKRYCVRPNNGIVEADSEAIILVMLQPYDQEGGDRGKHKFMVQTTYAPDNVTSDKIDLDNIWRTTPAELIRDFKLRCVFDHLNVNSSPPQPAAVAHSGSPASNASTVQTNGTDVEIDSSSIVNNVALGHRTPDSRRAARPKGEESSEELVPSQSSSRKGGEVLSENDRLRQEVNQLKRELLQAREEGLRHRVAGGGSPRPETAPTVPRFNVPANQQGLEFDLKQVLSHPQCLIIAVACLVLGVLFGKLLF